MAKRKIPNDRSLNDIIGEHMKKARCEKTLKLFEEKVGMTKKAKLIEQFWNYLKEKEMERVNTRDEDLGFEINFGAYPPDKKVSFVQLVF